VQTTIGTDGGGKVITSMPVSVLQLDPVRYVPHGCHALECAWPEKNCYVDVWIEALHALGLDPMPVLAFTLSVDFQGDQWTFFKPPHHDLSVLYGLQVHELNVWRPLLEHALVHLAHGQMVFTEADAFHLPDTVGTTYRARHTKTTIVLETIDPIERRVGYFHNGGYYSLGGEDYAALFDESGAPSAMALPLYAEYVRIDRLARLSRVELLGRSRTLLRWHLERRPEDNPFVRFERRFGSSLERFAKADLEGYHAYAFATLRQCGAAFELAAAYLRWLDPAMGAAAERFDAVSGAAKALVMKGARAVSARRPGDYSEAFTIMRDEWEAALREVECRMARG
jgi:hypothetical protein